MQQKAPVMQYTPSGVKTGEDPAPKPKVEEQVAPPEVTVIYHKGMPLEVKFKNWEGLTPRMISHSWRLVHRALLMTRQKAARALENRSKEIKDGEGRRHWD
ncbi:hypothetical protein LCGC14_1491580 [marine sediment metagenome]|uniref:Uncharacterized protein n=1 Tax=marine sediment metagenome TaxID=412755 RepID=A0A0F9J6L0_9ZZZZ